MEFEFYDLVWFWNNQSDNTNPMLGLWIGVLHMLGSELCYWILSEKGKLLLCKTVNNLTDREPRYPNIK